jgi:leader peptidase (prepilin peptidase) / N-methyltransferase
VRAIAWYCSHFYFLSFEINQVSYNSLVSILLVIPVLLGILMGYLINYLSDGFPFSQLLGLPTCQNRDCQHAYPWMDYILFARCRECGRGRNLRTFLVLALTVLAGLYVWFRPPLRLGFIPGMLILAYLLLVAVIDIEHRLILRTLSIFGLVITILAGFLTHGWRSTLIGGLFGFAAMLIVYFLGTRFSRWMTKRRNLEPGAVEEVFGSGDITLAMILGLFLGWPSILYGLLFGFCILGIFVIPFAFYLAIKRRFLKGGLIYIPLGVPFILSTIILIYVPALFPILLLP